MPLQYLKACGVLHPELKDRVRPAALALGPRQALLLAEERPGDIGEIYGDMGRYGEIKGELGRYMEV